MPLTFSLQQLRRYIFHQIFACGGHLLFPSSIFTYKAGAPHIFTPAAIYSTKFSPAAGSYFFPLPFLLIKLVPLTFSLQQLYHPPNFCLPLAVTFSLFHFYLKSWCPSHFPSSSYIFHQILACGGQLLFPSSFLLKKLVPSHFFSSSYLIHQTFACGGPLLFPFSLYI